jgi:hypothetical protein
MKSRLFQAKQPETKRQRSRLMSDNLPQIDSENYLNISGQKFLVVTRETRHWLSHENLVSIGAVPSAREFIICHPKQGQLKAWIDQFMQTDFTDLTAKALLSQAVRHIRHAMAANETMVNELAEIIKCEPEQCYAINDLLIPCINIAVFINARAGVCRHFNLLVAFLVQALIENDLLPNGQVTHYRYTNSDGQPAHALIHYETETTLYAIDAIKPTDRAIEEIIKGASSSSEAGDTLPVPEDEFLPPTQPYSYGSQGI